MGMLKLFEPVERIGAEVMIKRMYRVTADGAGLKGKTYKEMEGWCYGGLGSHRA